MRLIATCSTTHDQVDVIRKQGHGENDKDFEKRVGNDLADYFENFEHIAKKLDMMKWWAGTGKSKFPKLCLLALRIPSSSRQQRIPGEKLQLVHLDGWKTFAKS